MLTGPVVWPTMDNFCSCRLSGVYADADAAGLWLDGPEGNTCYDDPGESFCANGADEVSGGNVASDNIQAAMDLLGDGYGRTGLCMEVSGWLDDASKHGLLLFTQLHDEPGFATRWRGVWEPLPEASYDHGLRQQFGGGAFQNHHWKLFCHMRGIRPALVCDWDLAGEQVQAVVPNIDCNVQQAAALNVDLSCVPHGLRWKELVAEDHGYYNDPFSINMCIVPLRLQEHSNHSGRGRLHFGLRCTLILRSRGMLLKAWADKE